MQGSFLSTAFTHKSDWSKPGSQDLSSRSQTLDRTTEVLLVTTSLNGVVLYCADNTKWCEQPQSFYGSITEKKCCIIQPETLEMHLLMQAEVKGWCFSERSCFLAKFITASIKEDQILCLGSLGNSVAQPGFEPNIHSLGSSPLSVNRRSNSALWRY